MKEHPPFLGHLKKGLLFAISAPAGTGKTTVIKRLLKTLSPYIVQSVSCTTRAPRPGEKEGKDYFFLTEQQFADHEARGDFIETISIFQGRYGTLKSTVEKNRALGYHVFAIIDTEGALNLKNYSQAKLIFLHPPSLKVLEKRLTNRNTESPEMIQKRLARAHLELSQAPKFDYQIVHHEIGTTCGIVKSILIAEEHRFGLPDRRVLTHAKKTTH